MKQRSCAMKPLAAMILGAALAAGIATNLSAAPRERAGPKSALDLLKEQQELLLRECKLSEEQVKTLQEKFKAEQAALEGWEKTNAEKVKAAEDAAKAARKGTDEAAKKKAVADLKDLTTRRTQATADAEKAVQDALTEEQRMTWAGVKLAETTLARFKRANLTEDQTAKIKGACLAAARDLAGLTGDDKRAKQGRTTVQKSLQWAIENVVLTPEQRETTARKPVAKGGRK